MLMHAFSAHLSCVSQSSELQTHLRGDLSYAITHSLEFRRAATRNRQAERVTPGSPPASQQLITVTQTFIESDTLKSFLLLHSSFQNRSMLPTTTLRLTLIYGLEFSIDLSSSSALPAFCPLALQSSLILAWR